MEAVGAPPVAGRVAELRGGAEPPRLRGGLPLLGHLLEMRRAPIALFQRVHDECGEVGEFRLARQPVVHALGRGGAGGVLPRAATSSSTRPRPTRS